MDRQRADLHHTYTGQAWMTRPGIMKSLLAAVRRELGITPDASVFLFLGRMTSDRGVSDLAQACARLATVQWRNFVAGAGLAWAGAALLTMAKATLRSVRQR